MKKTSKQKTLLLAALFILIGLGVGVTLAYYSLIAQAVNEFQTATYNINITSSLDGEWGSKNVYISSDDTTNVPVLLRLNYNESWTKESGENIGVLSNTLSGSYPDTVNKNWSNYFNGDFVYSNGWYYYEYVLQPRQSISILNSISLGNYLNPQSPYYDQTIAQQYAGFDYHLDFYYETIQANSDAAQELWGKTATISGVNVTWS